MTNIGLLYRAAQESGLQKRLPGMLLLASSGLLLLSGCATGTSKLGGASGVGTPTNIRTTMQGHVKGGNPPVTGSAVTLYAASTVGYGAASTPLTSTTTDSSGNFTLSGFNCSPNDQLYIVATGGNPGLGGSGSNANLSMMAALGSCSTPQSFVNVNEVTTIASVYSLAAFMTDATHVGSSPTNTTGLRNAFATVNNLVNLPTGAALSVTPAYASGTAYYNTSIVPQGRINAMANALASCVNSQSANGSLSSTCSTLFVDTTITTASQIAGIPSGTTITPSDTLQAALNMAHCPGDKSTVSCGVNVAGIYGLVTANAFFQPTLDGSIFTTESNADMTLAVIFQGGGLGGGPATVGAPEATGLAIDAGGNIWVPTQSSTGGSVTVFNNQGAPITASGTSDGAYGGYTNGVFNPQSIAIDQGGNAWIGNAPVDGNHGLGDSGSLSQIQLNGTTLTTPLRGFTDSALLTPAPYGLAVDSIGNPWVSSNVAGTNNVICTGHTYGGSILEFDSGTGSVLNSGTPDGYLNFSDNSSCPGPIAFDQNGYLWTYDGGNFNGLDSLTGVSLAQLDPLNSGAAVGVYYASMAYLSKSTNEDPPATFWNLAIDGLGNSWFLNQDSNPYMDMVPNLSLATGDALNNGTWGADLGSATNRNGLSPTGAVAIDGGGNAWVGGNGLIGYSSTNATMDYTSPTADVVLLSPLAGYQATDPSVNASGRTGGTSALGGGYALSGINLTSSGGSIVSFVSTGVDGSGNVWVAGRALNYVFTGSSSTEGSQLTEFIGIAVPTVTPLASALSNISIGAKP